MRRVVQLDREVRSGTWRPDGGFELEGKTLGVIGLGGVGCTMAQLGAAFGMKVITWNRSGVSGEVDCEAVEIDDLMRRSDVVTLHIDLVPETEKKVIDWRRLELL